MSESNQQIKTYSDNEAAQELDNMELRQFKIIKAHYHKLQPIRYRGLHGFNLDDHELEIIKKAINIKKQGIKSWETAFKIAIATPVMSSDIGSETANIVNILLNGDGSANEFAASIIQEQYESYPQFLESITGFADWLHNSGSDDLGRTLNSFCDLFAKATVFDILHKNNLLPEHNPL